MQACSPTAADHKARTEVVADVKRVLTSALYINNLDVIPYGSFVSGFYNATSDLGACLCCIRPKPDHSKASLASRSPPHLPLRAWAQGLSRSRAIHA